MPATGDPTIHLAFRFHVNLYHSYRGDSLDERGIGKDIRIIRALLDGLDRLGAEGIRARCAWDIENYYSLELYLPRHAPDIIARIRSRVAAGLDEVEPMSWNNGILTVHTEEEFRDAIAWSIHNSGGSGLADLFGEWAPILRPQECMFSSSRIPACRELGIEAVSLFYSAAPFNGFGSFVPLLSLERRHNPLRLTDRASGASIRLLPAFSPADIVEHWCSLRGWLLSMRREQMASDTPSDLLLLIDMDADDSFWEGYLPAFASPLIDSLIPSLAGFCPLVRNVADLPWLRFTRPVDYLRTHGDAGELSLGQDLADGSFDGYSSWSEKAENARLWPRIALARRLGQLARRISSEGQTPPGLASDSDLTSASATATASERRNAGERAFLESDEKARSSVLRSLSTTHFGMASPVMNVDRLRDAFERAGEAVLTARTSLDRARALRDESMGGAPALYFDPRIDELPMGEGALSILPEIDPVTMEPAGRLVLMNPRSSRVEAKDVAGALFAAASPGSTGDEGEGEALRIEGNSIFAGKLELALLPGKGVMLAIGGRAVLEEPLSGPWVRFGRCVLSAAAAGISAAGIRTEAPKLLAEGKSAELIVGGAFALERGRELRWVNVYTLAAGLSSIRVDVRVEYPRTAHRGFDRAKARRLGRDWDARWKEVAPFELVPLLETTASRPARIWRQGFDGRVGSYDLDYYSFGPNRDLDSFDNHCTDGWVAVAGGGRGLLLAQADSMPAAPEGFFASVKGKDKVIVENREAVNGREVGASAGAFAAAEGWADARTGAVDATTANTLFAFCPMRLRFRGSGQTVRMNPFGSYYGKQWRYPTAITGLGRFAALATGDNFDPYAPSWEGASLRFSLLIAPYEGDCPPASLRRDALIFASAPIQIGGFTAGPTGTILQREGGDT